MLTDPGLYAEDERDLLARVAGWPECASLSELTHSVLTRLAHEQGMDFATALLYDRLRRSEQHGPFIRRVDELLSQPPEPASLDALLAVAPGAYYQELPGTGADGRLLRQRVAAHGCRTAVIPTRSMGTVAENGRIILDWLAEHAHEKILLASLSKGAADIKAALAQPGADTAFRPVVAWLNLSGMASGTPVANWMLRGPLTRLFFRALCWWKGLDFQVTRQLQWGPGSALDFPLVLPAHVLLINVVGFPLQEHFTSKVLRGFHRRIAHLGPNDGLILLADVCALPGLVYPVWGADHNLRPAWDIRRLVAALAHYLAETLGLWGGPGVGQPFQAAPTQEYSPF
jgi:hypothetical protein